MESKIKEARKAVGLTQQAMSEKLNIPKRTIENWESGVNSCPEWAEKLVIDRLSLDERIILDSLADRIEKDYGFFCQRREADDLHSMRHWCDEARRVNDQFFRIAGRGMVINVEGLDTQKNDVMSTFSLMDDYMAALERAKEQETNK